MTYCRRCVIPDTRPHISFDVDGVCDACRSHDSKPAIDWAARSAAFRAVVASAQSRSRGYDCIVPVSGGKDSTWQVVMCLEHGLKPLAVTWKTPARTEIGRRNLENLVRLGVDHIDYQISPLVERVFMLEAYERFGSTAIPMHMALFAIPLMLAVRFGVPLVVWGENSAFEYGGTYDERTGFRLDAAWLKKYGVTHGTTAKDWVSPTLTAKALTPYFGPTESELASAGVQAVFLGYYFEWDPQKTADVARQHGFESGSRARTGVYEFADLDDDFIAIHHYLKWYKFGFTRAFDNLSIEIRHGRITRDEAIATLRARGDDAPREDIRKFCAFAGIEEARFYEIAEKFRNTNVWTQRDGVWQIDGFLIPDWRWT